MMGLLNGPRSLALGKGYVAHSLRDVISPRSCDFWGDRYPKAYHAQAERDLETETSSKSIAPS